MIDISDNEWRRAFSTWLRTGRLPLLRGLDGVELKFNPWHDPDTGRFTFAGSAVRGGAIGTDARSSRSGPHRSAALVARDDSTRPSAASGRAASGGKAGSEPSARGTWTGSGFTGGGGGSVGGGGASGTWGSRRPEHRPIALHPASVAGPAMASASSRHVAPIDNPASRSASIPSEPFRTVVRNGYTYRIDARDRTRHVSGALTIAEMPMRSKPVQKRAGGTDRRSGDDGGHYIAARFNGPAEAFNHFAQDANFNRGDYRRLEDQWAHAKRAGKRVFVKILPHFEGLSSRPATIDVSWTVNGYEESQKFPNERSEKPRGKR